MHAFWQDRAMSLDIATLRRFAIARTLFTPTFAVGRVAGWCAHVEEQRRVGRLIRPRSRYVDASLDSAR